jgi:hypothetical protein
MSGRFEELLLRGVEEEEGGEGGRAERLRHAYLFVVRPSIAVCWFGPEMPPARARMMRQLEEMSGVRVRLVTESNLPLVAEFPLHPAFEYLSATHKADYMRTYMMHVHGGGYSDVKGTGGSWLPAFEAMSDFDVWINGYPETGRASVAYSPAKDRWWELVGNCAYICRPRTPLTTEWFGEMNRLLDSKLEALRANPAKRPDDRAEWGPYPIQWNEMLGRIFHKVLAKYVSHARQMVPRRKRKL